MQCSGRHQGHRPVALLAEGVDRNSLHAAERRRHRWSPSSRRAWIEITPSGLVFKIISVALLAEGVDRNDDAAFHAPTARKSPSSRRAWIEMLIARMRSEDSTVALLAEGVDRNTLLLTFDVERDSRPPRGGRG